jgi:hypothetical protein
LMAMTQWPQLMFGTESFLLSIDFSPLFLCSLSSDEMLYVNLNTRN